MSHLLATSNPAAAAAIHPEPQRPRLPGVGEMVVYHMRAGYARNGRTTFPAIVQGHGDRGTLMLTVVIDAGDLADESLVEERRVGTEFHCWERLGPDHAGFAEMRAEVAHALKAVSELRGEIKSLDTAVFGDFDRPRISIIDIMQDFENRLRILADKGKAK